MTPDRFNQCLTALRWASDTLASALRCDVSLPRAWGSGEITVPSGVAAWLETLAQVHEGLPPPKTWKGKRGARRRFEVQNDMSQRERAVLAALRAIIAAMAQDDDVRRDLYEKLNKVRDGYSAQNQHAAAGFIDLLQSKAETSSRP